MKTKKSVYIKPIVTRDKTGIEVPEIGAGGGKGDLYQIHELELPDEITLQKLETLLSEHITDEATLSQIKDLLKMAFTSEQRALALDEYGLADDADIQLKELASMLSSARNVSESRSFEEEYSDRTTIVCRYLQYDIAMSANRNRHFPILVTLLMRNSVSLCRPLSQKMCFHVQLMKRNGMNQCPWKDCLDICARARSSPTIDICVVCEQKIYWVLKAKELVIL